MTVYALIDERDETTCYIGHTLYPLDQRLKQHKTGADSRDKWIWLQRHPVRIQKLCDGLEFEEKREIARFMDAGIILFNNTMWPKMTEKAQREYKIAQRAWIENRHSFDI